MKTLLGYVDENILKKNISDCLDSLKDLAEITIPLKTIIKGKTQIQLVQYFLDYLDKYYIDNMRVHGGLFPVYTDRANGYYRSDSYKQHIPEEIFDVIGVSKDSSVYTYFGFHSHIDFYKKFFGGKILRLTPKLSVLVTIEKTLPYCSIPVQELFGELIMCGMNPFKGLTKVESPGVRSEILKDIPSHKINIKKKLSTLEREFEEKFGYSVVMIPFSSGTAANEAAMQVIGNYKREGNTYIHPYWYYENIPTATRVLNLVNDYKNSDISLINIEPTNYLLLDHNVDVIETIDILEFYLEEAKKSQKRLFTLVLDMTVDPFFLQDKLLEFVKLNNTRLIISISLSKHQNGDRRYFFGLLVVPKKDKSLVHKISAVVDKVGGTLTSRHLRFFPTISLEKMSDVIKNVKRINSSLFGAKSKEWCTKSYTFNTVFYPKRRVLKKMENYIRYLTEDEAFSFVIELNKDIWNLVCNYVVELGSPRIEFGDSFGLDVTRVTVQGGEFYFGEKYLELKLPRLSPGTGTDFDELYSFTRELLFKLDDLFKEYAFNK